MIENKLAPIVLFVYNRPSHTKKTIEALQKNILATESDLFIYSDAAKNEKGLTAVSKVRAYLKSVIGFKSITIIEREENFGLAKSIINGVTKIVNSYGKVIVLEDDLVTSPFFLQYMNNSLNKYEKNNNVYSITGYSYSDENSEVVKEDAYFLPITSSWSWATWKDKWSEFSQDEIDLRKCLNNRKCKNNFNFNNSYPFYRIAKNQLAKKIDSWAIYWYFSVFQKQGLTLYPKVRLVKNIGHDGSGTHCASNKKEEIISNPLPKLTDTVEINQEYQSLIENILRAETRQNDIRIFKGLIKEKITKYFSMYIISRVLQIKSYIQIFFHPKIYGKNTFIDNSVRILGYSNIIIGNNTIVSEETWLNVNYKNHDKKRIYIGNNCYIGKRNFLLSGEQIFIGDYCMTALECKFLGSNHNFDTVMQPYITTGITYDSIIKLGTNVWLGAGVTVLGNVTIGYGSIVGAGSLVTKSIPPFCVAVGSPAKVIKRYSFLQEKWVHENEYSLNEEVNIPSEEEYLNILKSKAPKILLPLQASSKKFGNLI